MQLYAFDEKSQCIEASKASKQRNYRCMECLGPVRSRSGVYRQPHFFHLDRSGTCRQNGKSQEHLSVQLHLQELLPQDDCHLEMRFPSINRIGDVVWISKKIVFEIQCSPISSNEIQERTAAYALQGYQVVWIFHDHQFNRNRLSPAESLCRRPYYYTNIDKEGNGFIYDQENRKRLGRRIIRGAIYPIDPAQPKRTEDYRLYFQGDMTDLKILHLPTKRRKSNIFILCKKAYLALLHFYLEKACK